ncbi:unnamed protein product [Agarophyton chilense]
MMPKRALGDITNRHANLNNSFPHKRAAKAQKTSNNFSNTKNNHHVLSEKAPSVHKMFPSKTNTKYIDIDAYDKLNRVEGSDLAAVIHKNHLLAEKRHNPGSNLLESHKTVTRGMRAILVDWIADVCVCLKLKDSSLHLCVHILDRFLHSHEPTRKTLQLVGSVCLYIAAKYEEIYAPAAKDFVTLSDGAFSMDDVVVMEATILNALRFEVSTPYCLTFLNRIGKTLEAKGIHNKVAKNVLVSAQMFVELAMVDGRHLKYRPSHLSAAAVLLAMQKLDINVSWCESLSFHSGWSEGELVGCVEDVHQLVDEGQRSSRSLNAIRRKFFNKTV